MIDENELYNYIGRLSFDLFRLGNKMSRLENIVEILQKENEELKQEKLLISFDKEK